MYSIVDLLFSKVNEFFVYVFSRIFKNYLLLGSLILMPPLAFLFMLLQTTVNFSLMGKNLILAISTVLLEVFR